MANVLIDNTKLTALGNAIRAKTGKSDLMTVSQMATEVASISGGVSLEYVTDASGTTAVITGTEGGGDPSELSLDDQMPIVNKVTFNGDTIMDISDTTAVAADVAEGKYFYSADGTKTAGTSNVDPDDWVRPSNYPDYSKLDLTGQEAVYFSVDANDRDSAYFHVRFSGTNMVCEKGVLENGVFTSNVTVATKSGNNQWFSDYVTESDVLDSNGFIVYKVSGTITVFYSYQDKVTLNGHQVRSSESPCVEIYGRLPNLTQITYRGNIHVRSITLSGLSSLTNISNAFFGDNYLKKVRLTDLSALTNLLNAFYDCRFLRVVDLDGYIINESESASSLTSAFRTCRDLTKINATFDFTNATNYSLDSFFRDTNSYFDNNNVRSYGSPTSFSYTFAYNHALTSFDSSKVVSFSNCTDLQYMFLDCYLLKEIDLSDADLSSVTNTTGIFQRCRTMKRAILPSSLTVVSAAFFSDCTSLREIHFGSTTPPTCANTNAWNGLPNTVKIYVPYSEDHSILAAYQSATNWSSVTSYLVEEEP